MGPLAAAVRRSRIDRERSGPADGRVRALPGAVFISQSQLRSAIDQREKGDLRLHVSQGRADAVVHAGAEGERATIRPRDVKFVGAVEAIRIPVGGGERE